ncbi:hypothetical protein KKG61_08000 [bacterium]|nr:hypothetical protein [bacterium]MBU1600025.1 hypothetical protein [bacterium]
MKRFRLISLVFIILVIVSNVSAEEFKYKGILIRHLIKEGDKLYGEPGQLVECSINPVISDFSNITVRLDTSQGLRIFEKIPDYYIIPYDPQFSLSWIFLTLKSRDQIYTDNRFEELEYRYHLAKNSLSLFPSDHHLREEVLSMLCELTERYERWRNNRKEGYGKSIVVCEKYLREYPDGIYRDRIEWQLVQLQNDIYEYEGCAEGPLKQAKAYEDYLSNHPNSKVANEIKLTITHLYRVAYECIEYPEEEGQEGFTKKDGEKFLEKSVKIYQGLLKSNNLTTRETANIKLYNIKHNRRVYCDSNEWDWE